MLRKPYLAAAFALIALLVIFFLPVFTGGKVLAPLDILSGLLRPWAETETIQVHNAFTYDAISQYLPYDWSAAQSLKEDGYIGWNPYTHSGSAIVENTMLCPGDWHHHLYRFLPFWTAWNAGIILQFTIAGLGMLMLMRSLKIPAACAFVGIVAFCFYSQFTLWIYHRWILGAMCWSPWILWSLLRAKRAERTVDPLSALFIGLAFRGGHLQTCLFVVLLVGLAAAADWWRTEDRWKPAVIARAFGLYLVSGLLGTVLALDVIVETVPALLHGKREMSARGWIDTLYGLPTLVTSILPSSLGTPQGIDVMKFFRSDLFSIKFMGAIPLLLASLACFRREAPGLAKLLFVAGIVLPFTPADQWLYSRVSVIFALGGGWLAAWYLATASQLSPSRRWRIYGCVFGAAILLWAIGSGVILAKQEWLETKLHQAVIANMPEGKLSRTTWMLERADHFLHECLLWTPRNLATVALIATGLFACSRIHRQNPHASWFAVLVALCTFGELALFSSTWITFGPKPSTTGLYETPAWMEDFQRETAGAGSVFCYSREYPDYMQLNVPSAYGIRFSEGYETVTPRRIDPYLPHGPEAPRFAELGISHLLVPPGMDMTPSVGWREVINSPKLRLFCNEHFESAGIATLAGGTRVPVATRFETANRRQIDLPAGTLKFRLTESHNPGWSGSTSSGRRLSVQRGPDQEMLIDFGTPLEEPTQIELQYSPPYRDSYRWAIGGMLLLLAGVALRGIFFPSIPSQPSGLTGTSPA